MKRISILLGALALLGTIVPPVLFFNGQVGQDTMKLVMVIACGVWFVSAPFWMKTT